MPLTFAHPAAVLPFSRESRYLNFSAMVIGSMAPDFEYFLRGEPAGAFGHSLAGFFILNLPLVMVVYFLYHTFVHEPLFAHLPRCLQAAPPGKSWRSPAWLKAPVFIYSALFGMATHVAWDSLTHGNGLTVNRYPALFTETFHLLGRDIPLYKFLQHGSTLLGLSLIMAYLWFGARSRPSPLRLSAKWKFHFWTGIFSLAVLIGLIWFAVDWIPVSSYGVAVVRVIDSTLISLLIVSVYLKLSKT